MVTRCCVLANGNVVTASYDQTLKFWDVEQMMCVRTINDHWYGQFIYCGIACGYVVAICTDDNNLLISDTHYTSLPGTLEGHTADVMSFCALGRDKLVSASDDCNLKIWNVVTRKNLSTLEGHTDAVLGCCVLDNGNVVSASADNTLKLWACVWLTEPPQ